MMRFYSFLLRIAWCLLLAMAWSCSSDAEVESPEAIVADFPTCAEQRRAIETSLPLVEEVTTLAEEYATDMAAALTALEEDLAQLDEQIAQAHALLAGTSSERTVTECRAALEAERQRLQQSIRNLRQAVDGLKSSYPQLQSYAASLTQEQPSQVAALRTTLAHYNTLCDWAYAVPAVAEAELWRWSEFEFACVRDLFADVAESTTPTVQAGVAINGLKNSCMDCLTTTRGAVEKASKSIDAHRVESLLQAMQGWLPARMTSYAGLAAIQAECDAFVPFATADADQPWAQTLQKVEGTVQGAAEELMATYHAVLDGAMKVPYTIDQQRLIVANTRADRVTVEAKQLLAPFLALPEEESTEGKSLEELVTLTIDRWDGRYAVGERVSIRAVVPNALDAICEVWVNGLCISSEVKHLPRGTYNLLTRCDQEPATVMLRLQNTDPAQTKDYTDIGYGVGVEQFRPAFTKPADFHAWWMEQVALVRQTPMQVKLTPVEVPATYASSYVCYDLEVSCSEGGAPVRGYMALPKGAKTKSLPVCLFLHGAGVNGTSNRSRIDVALQYARQGGGSISLDLNAHGMLNGQPQSYYDNLNNTTLKDYRYWPLESRESYYFRGMFLRAQRALDYLCSRAEWDGERVLVIGSSQGGAQTAAICGLDPRVTHAVIRAPAMMDTAGSLAGRKCGWPYLPERYGFTDAFMQDGPYFDTAFFLEHNRAKVLYECGWIDTTCTPSSSLTGYNLCAGEKELCTYPYRAHSSPKGKYGAEWSKTINARFSEFIREALK